MVRARPERLSSPLAPLLLLTLIGLGCQGVPEPTPPSPVEVPPPRAVRTSGAMGVAVRMTIAAPPTAETDAAFDAAFTEVRRWERVLSSYDPRGELRQLEESWRPGQWSPVSEELGEALAAALRWSTATAGAFDPTVGALSRLWRDARAQGSPPDEAALRAARGAIGLPLLEFDHRQRRVRIRHPNLKLDFGGCGKGFIADRALEKLVELGFPAALVDCGGDLAIGAPPPGSRGWIIARVEADGEETELLLADCGLATSGDAEQRLIVDGVRHSHILSPRKREPLQGAPTVTVRAPTAGDADAWATAISVDPSWSERLRQRAGFEVWTSNRPDPKKP